MESGNMVSGNGSGGNVKPETGSRSGDNRKPETGSRKAKITKLDDGGLQYECTCGRTVVLYRDKGDTTPITRVSRCFACAEKFTDGTLELLRVE